MCLYVDEKDNPAWSSPGFRVASALFTTYSVPMHVRAQYHLHILRTANPSEEVRCLRAMLPAYSTSLPLKILLLVRKLCSALSHEALSFTKAGMCPFVCPLIN